MNNREISNLFSTLAKLMDIHRENSFKIKTYSNAAFAIDKLPFQLNSVSKEKIPFIKDIGARVAENIIEILDTGQLSRLNELILQTPQGILELMKIKGIGAKKIAVIWHELGIETPGELLYACNENRLIDCKGFGKKTQSNIQNALEFYFSNQGHYLYAQVETIANDFQKILESHYGSTHTKCVGAFARQEDTIEILEWVLMTTVSDAINVFSTFQDFELVEQNHQSLLYQSQQNLKFHFHISDEENFAKVSFLKSCSSKFLKDFESFFNIKIEQETFASEADFFKQLHIPYIPKYGRSTFSQGVSNSSDFYDNIIQFKDIKGVIHNHSVWSDGAHTIEEMAIACIEKGYEYLVMSDHSASSFYANGLSIERIKKQQDEIELLNQKLAPFKNF
ncbi:MAG: PHP domain-containing protein [Bacteroidetes bacterium OLB11]|nr:MAG: PHP domain-containing protein [Bacteroidetes bacterium OLB11]